MDSLSTEITLYTAPWLICVEQPPIKDGGLVVRNGRIVDVGKIGDLECKYKGVKKVALRGVLLPPLINCHTHLELSAFEKMERPSQNSVMADWIEDLLQKRQEKRTTQDIATSAKKAAKKQYDDGVGLLVDIHNDPSFALPVEEGYPELYSILEIVGPTKERARTAMDLVEELSGLKAVSPHAPYSTRAQLIVDLKKRCIQEDALFSIHIGESADELEFLKSKSGPFQKFLKKRESWEESMLEETTSQGSIYYLHKLSVLGSKTLLVHCIHVSDEEIALLAQTKTKVCLCPGSNEFLRVGRPPLDKFLQNGIIPAIGTDSLASNESLDMWREMKLLREFFPDVAPKTILTMATRAGAVALGRENDYGGLTPGKKALFLEINNEKYEEYSEQQLLDSLTSDGKPCGIKVIRADLTGKEKEQ